MKSKPLIYVLAISISVVVLLIFIANGNNDRLLAPPTTPYQKPTTDYWSEDRDSPSEAVQAVGSQINHLREEQAALKEDVNQTVTQLHRELQTLHSAIKQLHHQQDTLVKQSRIPPPNAFENTNEPQPKHLPSGAEPIAPDYPMRPDTPRPAIQSHPTWRWIEDHSMLTPDVNYPSSSLVNELSEYLDNDALQTITTKDQNTDTPSLIIPPATIIKGVTLTATIGRLPVRGQLNEPWPVKVISTMEGYAANGYAVDTAQMIWDGKAFGDANFECVRVILTRATAVLPGAVISFVEAADSEKGLGYLSNAWGQPCLKGKLVSNAAKQMTAEAILGIAQGIGEGYADTQRTRTVSPEGNTVESITGEEARVLIGQGFAKSVGNVRNYLASRYDIWDAIYVPPEQEVVINVDQPLEFIYDKKQKLYDLSVFALKIGDDDSSTRLD